MRQNGFHPSLPPDPTLTASTHTLITTPIRPFSFYANRLCLSPRPNATLHPHPRPGQAPPRCCDMRGSSIHTLPSLLQHHPSLILNKLKGSETKFSTRHYRNSCSIAILPLSLVTSRPPPITTTATITDIVHTSPNTLLSVQEGMPSVASDRLAAPWGHTSHFYLPPVSSTFPGNGSLNPPSRHVTRVALRIFLTRPAVHIPALASSGTQHT